MKSNRPDADGLLKSIPYVGDEADGRPFGYDFSAVGWTTALSLSNEPGRNL